MTEVHLGDKSISTKPFTDLVGEEVVSFIFENIPTKVATRVARALDHYSRAPALIGIDEEMGAIRLIAAEEELVVAIFEWLKLEEKRYPEHKDFVRKFKNHVVKLSFYPTLSQLRFILADMLRNGFVMEGLKDVILFTAKPVVDGKSIRLAILDEQNKELIRQNPLAIKLSHGEISSKDAVPLLLADFVKIVKDQHNTTVKEFLAERADFRNKLLYATDAAAMGMMEDGLAELIETFKETFHDLLWVLAMLLGDQPVSKEWGLVSQFIGLYREVLIMAGVLRPDNTAILAASDIAIELPPTNEIIEVMARADVNYFWKDGGNRLEAFEKPVAAGVRTRMEFISAALMASGFTIQKTPK